MKTLTTSVNNNLISNIWLTIITIITIILCSQCSSKIDNYRELESDPISNAQDAIELKHLGTLGQIDRRLVELRGNKGVIFLGPESNVELGISTEERIARNIDMVESLMEQNSGEIDELKDLLNEAESQNNDLKRDNNAFSKLFKNQNKHIDQLKNQISVLEEKNKELNDHLFEVRRVLKSTEFELETVSSKSSVAYFTTGSYKELKEKGIVQKEGGLLWLGRTKKVNENIDINYFNKLSMDKLQIIPVAAKSINLISSHPSDSYTVETKEGGLIYLKINDPEHFWQITKLLVVEAQQ